MGGYVKYQRQPEWFAQVDVYKYNLENASKRHGWNLDPQHIDDLNPFVETVLSPKQNFNNLHSSYLFGVLYNTTNETINQYDVAYIKSRYCR